MRDVIEVAIALVWKGERLLVTERRAGSHLAGYWEFPGGKLAPGETPRQCAEREVLEETGASVRARGLRATIEHDYPERSVRLHPVDCEWISGEPEPRQVAAVAWVRPGELERYAFPAANADLVRELSRGAPSRSPR